MLLEGNNSIHQETVVNLATQIAIQLYVQSLRVFESEVESKIVSSWDLPDPSFIIDQSFMFAKKLVARSQSEL